MTDERAEKFAERQLARLERRFPVQTGLRDELRHQLELAYLEGVKDVCLDIASIPGSSRA